MNFPFIALHPLTSVLTIPATVISISDSDRILFDTIFHSIQEQAVFSAIVGGLVFSLLLVWSHKYVDQILPKSGS